MKDFSWSYFCKTGQIDAYLLFKECEVNRNSITSMLKMEEEEDKV
ncbi:YqzL family protein [Tepidibacillus marianensis]